MGFKEQKAIFEKFREVAPSAFVNGIHTELKRVVISDGPTRLKFCMGPNHNYMFTGREFYDQFMTPIRIALRQGKLQYWIETFDVETIPLPEKRREQKKRTDSRIKSEEKKKVLGADEESKIASYPDDTVFGEGGVYMGTGMTRFDIRGVSKSSALRRKLLVFVCEMLLVNDPLPLGVSIIVDFLGDAPLQFIRQPDSLKNLCFRLRNYRTFFAESDQRLVFWCRVFANADKQDMVVEVDTTDSDLCVMLGVFVEDTRPVCPIYLSRGKIVTRGRTIPKGQPTRHPDIHIQTLVDVMNRAKITFAALLPHCHAHGSDYVEKESLTPGCGFAFSWATFLKSGKTLLNLDFDTGDLVKENKVTLWEKLLCHPDMRSMFPVFFADDSIQSTETFPESKTNKIDQSVELMKDYRRQIPKLKSVSDEKFREGVVDLLWATQYHHFPWALIQAKPPSCFVEQADVDFAKLEKTD